MLNGLYGEFIFSSCGKDFMENFAKGSKHVHLNEINRSK